MAIALSGGVRSALQSLQSNAAEATATQLRLATGKRVNSAVDNPSNYFTSSSLNQRATQLSNLLDGQSNAVQTVQAASKGIDGITKLVQAAQSTIKQAQNEAAQNRPTKASDPLVAALATTTEVAATNKSLRDIALDKKLVDSDTDATNNAATSSSSGNLGVASTSTNLALTVSAGATTYTVALSTGATLRDVVNEINKSGIATASVDEAGKLNVTGTGSDKLKVGLGASTTAAGAITDAAAGGQNAKLGFAAGDASTGISSTGANSAVRANLIQQFNDLRTQINQLAKDAGYNGTNLLDGNKLSVVFNEKTGTNQSKLDIQGSTVTADNLGIDTAVTGTATTGQFSIQNDSDLAKAGDALTGALSSLRSLSSTFGANLSVVQTRQDFTKSLIDTLKVGADNLVLADSNEEGANLLALNTRQQLSQTSLQLASQADQAVLRLF